MLQNQNVRKAIYVLVIGAGVAAVTFGIVDQSQADTWTAVILGVIGVVGGGTAIGNISPKPGPVIDAGQVQQLVRDTVASAAGGVVEAARPHVERTVAEARAELERRFSQHRQG